MEHVSRMRTRFGDVDHAGILYFPQIIEYCMRAWEEFFVDHLGFEFPKWVESRGVASPVVKVEAEFFQPIRHGDLLEISTCVTRLGRSSVTYRHRVRRQADGKLCARVDIVQAFADLKRYTSVPMPDSVRDSLSQYLCEADST